MEGPGNNRPVKRAGDSNNPHGAPDVRDWQRNTWTGPMPMNVSPFEEPDDAPELLQQRSENLRDREGAFWQQATNGYQRTAGNETQRTNAVKTGKSTEKPKKKTTGGTSAGMKAALALVAVTFITICVLYFIVFRVREIKVEGNELISRSDVIRLSGIRYGESILTLSEEDTKRNLEAQAVSEAKRTGNSNYYSLQFRYLDKMMPGTVVISVKEREPCCWMTLRGIMFVMDKARMVLYESEDPNIRPANLAEVKGLNIRGGDHAGQTLTLTSSVQQSIFDNLFLELKVLSCVSEIQEVDLSNTSSILMLTRDGYTVSLGDKERIHAKLRSMLYVRDKLRELGKAGGAINVSVPENPTYSPAVN